ncbi:hypothetical protein PIB30_113553, partial [Stylosanthes scabra]|nr:hypothetical protein [Stylosanthes scabra]
MVINVFEAMQHPADEETEECMRTDIIDMLVKEIQDEEILKKSTAYYEETFTTFGDTNLEFFVQENNAELQKSEETSENNKEEMQKIKAANERYNVLKNTNQEFVLQEIQSIVQENKLDEVQANSATHMQPLVEEIQLRKNTVQPHEDNKVQQKT